jgi:hypothetical protein
MGESVRPWDCQRSPVKAEISVGQIPMKHHVGGKGYQFSVVTNRPQGRSALRMPRKG